MFEEWNLNNTYADLPESLFSFVKPTPVKKPELVIFNENLFKELGFKANLNDLDSLAQVFSGNILPNSSIPIAQAYAGHQFGHFSILGDGRAILIGEQNTPDGILMDIQLKGSGPTPYSRQGDGRAALGAMLREHIISEAMHALRIPTTRSLAVVASGETIYRERGLPGSILTRVAKSHLRVGTFELAASSNNINILEDLMNYAIDRHYPEVKYSSTPALNFLEKVSLKQSKLVSEWMRVGFIHGVMNTDNMTISGETIDYGPCAFIDKYDPSIVFSSIDHGGRYAFGNQPSIANWNIARLAESLLPLIHNDREVAISEAEKVVEAFKVNFRDEWLAMMQRKLGLIGNDDGDQQLIWDLLEWMSSSGADYTNTFYLLSNFNILSHSFYNKPQFLSWYERWESRLQRIEVNQSEAQNMMKKYNPVYIPRNHKVEEALDAAEVKGDFSILENFLNVLSQPYEETSGDSSFMEPRPDGMSDYKTYCGT